MIQQFGIIKGGDQKLERNVVVLASMHYLRDQVFWKELKWHAGSYEVNSMEFDDYDRLNPNTHYIVRINGKGSVDASCRIMPTDQPYMLKEKYPDAVQTMPLPQDKKIWDISRLCSATKGSNAVGQMFAAAYEFALVNGITEYISLTTDSLLPVYQEKGLEPMKLGPLYKTPNDMSYALSYQVNLANLQKIREKSKIKAPILFDFFDENQLDLIRKQGVNDNQAIILPIRKPA